MKTRKRNQKGGSRNKTFKKKDFEQETLLEKLQHNEIKIKY